MQHCKKLVLMSHDAVAKLTDKSMLRTTNEVMTDLDKDMDKILKQKAEDSEKWKSYEQALQRYLHFAGEQRKPIEISLPENGEVKKEEEEEASRSLSAKDKDLLHQLDLLMPVKFQNNGSALYHLLASPRHRSLISWNENGQLIISGQKVEGTSIIDLISDASRPRQSAQANGWSQFAEILKKVNAPQELVQNKEYKSFINSQKGEGLVSHAYTTQQPQKTSSGRIEPRKQHQQNGPKRAGNGPKRAAPRRTATPPRAEPRHRPAPSRAAEPRRRAAPPSRRFEPYSRPATKTPSSARRVKTCWKKWDS